MSIATNVHLKGIVQIDLHQRDGRLVKRVEVPNRIVDYGLDLLSRLAVSAFINDAVENFETSPLQAIAVGTGADTSQVPFGQTGLEAEWKRQRIEQVEILRASFDVKDAAAPAVTVLQFRSKIHGAYGNRIKITVLDPSADNAYRVQVDDTAANIWNGSTWVPGPRSDLYEASDLAELLAEMAGDPTVQASAPDLSWSGALTSNAAGTLMSGGGGGVVVAATFNNANTDTVGLTEAALFTDDDAAGAGVMFNMVRFPVINVTSELDITFRWKLLFQESVA